MNDLVKVARYHLVKPVMFTTVPWASLLFSFLVCISVFAMVPVSHHDVLTSSGLISVPNKDGRYTGGLTVLFAFAFVTGVTSIGRSLPFGLMLGMSRRSYYTGTALLGVALALANATALTVLQVIESATGGWGVNGHFFRVPYLLDGPWYATWLTSFVGLAGLFVYGMWYGTVYRRWGAIGVVAFTAAQVLVALAIVAAVSLTNGWHGVGGFFTGLTALGLTGVVAALAVILLVGGHATIRRAAV
ncbi:MAG TPA: hypothetical protein VK817_19725 [Trebonia sp.]|jgi:hypothetical protein|nr:hypothetical protein [Trebonia sp.]